MTIRLMAAAIALAVALPSAAFATTTIHHRVVMVKKPIVVSACTTLERQFSADVHSHQKAMMLSTAESLDARGTKLCSENHQIRGEWDLRMSLRDIGVVPKA